jgi:NAD(P)-dependent dehydrogenase (short-subunit alcohol dehydrogenase family)
VSSTYLAKGTRHDARRRGTSRQGRRDLLLPPRHGDRLALRRHHDPAGAGPVDADRDESAGSLSPAAEAWRDAYPERFAEHAAAVPLGRTGDPEQDIGRAVAAPASDDMGYLTGATVMLNGGHVLLG